jgi:hypothetical protein
MPRKSAAALSVVSPIVDHRPPPPDDMPEAQQDLWRTIVNRMPHDWFRAEHRELLRAYCQHVAIARLIARQIEAFAPKWLAEDGGLERFDGLAKVLERAHRMILALARSMRITHQSLDPKVMGVKARDDGGRDHPPPWERFKSIP